MEAILLKPYSVAIQGFQGNSDNEDSVDKYIPGVCNIGKKEIEGRRKAMYFGLALLVVAVALLEYFKASHIWHLIIFIPAASFAVSAQQLYFKFCVNFGMRGVFNFSDMGKTFTVDQQEYYKKDRAKAMQMIIAGVVFGVLVAVVYYYL